MEAISSDLALNAIAQRVAELLTQYVGADVCFVHLVDEARHRLSLIGATPPFDQYCGVIELTIGDGVAGWVAEHRELAVIRDKWHDPRYLYLPELRGRDYSVLVSAPMISSSAGVVGVVNLHWKEPQANLEEELIVLQDVANIFAGTLENSILLGRLAARERQLSIFAAATIEAQEAERRRIAGDIHDALGQGLLSLLFHLDAVAGACGSAGEDAETELAKARAIVELTLNEVRATITKLRPGVLDDLGLSAALESLARDIPALRVVADVASVRLEPHIETALFRIAQEALANVVKHAHAKGCLLRLRIHSDEVVMTISDNGSGFDTSSAIKQNSFGILGMRERVELIHGKIDILSRENEGSKIVVRVPLGSLDAS